MLGIQHDHQNPSVIWMSSLIVIVFHLKNPDFPQNLHSFREFYFTVHISNHNEHFGYSTKMMLKKGAIFYFALQASWDM